MKHILFLLALAPALAFAQTGTVKDSVRVLTDAEISTGTAKDAANLYFIDTTWKKIRMDSLARFARVKLIGDRGDITVSGADGLTWSVNNGAITGAKLATGAVDLTATTVTGTLPVNKGGTGSATQNFVDLSTTQSSIGGAKTFTSTVTGARFDPTSSSATGTGMFLPATNRLGFSTSGISRVQISPGGKVIIGADTALTRFRIVGGDGDQFQLDNTGQQYTQFTFSNNNSLSKGGMYFDNTNNEFGIFANAGVRMDFYTDGASSAQRRMRITTAGEMWIAGTTDRGAYNLQVNGTGVWGAGAYVDGSDAEVKENVKNIGNVLEKVLQLRPVSYNYIQSFSPSAKTQVGLIAQDVYSVFSEDEYVNGIVSSEGDTMGLSYSSFAVLLIKAIQEQQAQIEQLKNRISQLENK